MIPWGIADNGLMLLAIGVALLALVLLGLAWHLRRRTGLPWAPVVENDMYAGHAAEPLYSARYGLSGRPDYLLRQAGVLVPVEVKPGRHARHPYDSDLMQLAAYCLLLEEQTGQAPPYGLLRYAEQSFRLDYTPVVRSDVLDLIAEMRDLLDAEDCGRSHTEAQRCAGCGFFDICDDALEI
jgi:CRISPR-associated exonuclease Cas4